MDIPACREGRKYTPAVTVQSGRIHRHAYLLPAGICRAVVVIDPSKYRLDRHFTGVAAILLIKGAHIQAHSPGRKEVRPGGVKISKIV